jgi:transposase-like protein
MLDKACQFEPGATVAQVSEGFGVQKWLQQHASENGRMPPPRGTSDPLRSSWCKVCMRLVPQGGDF